MALSWDSKDPQEVLDYDIVWTDRLDGDTISTSVWALTGDDSVLVQDDDSFTDTVAKIWLSAGTLGATYYATNTITTAGGRTMEQTVRLRIKAR